MLGKSLKGKLVCCLEPQNPYGPHVSISNPETVIYLCVSITGLSAWYVGDTHKYIWNERSDKNDVSRRKKVCLSPL